jgi:hypothetical protein
MKAKHKAGYHVSKFTRDTPFSLTTSAVLKLYFVDTMRANPPSIFFSNTKSQANRNDEVISCFESQRTVLPETAALRKFAATNFALCIFLNNL